MTKPLVKDTNFTLEFILDKILPKKNGQILTKDQLESFEIEDITNGSAFMSTIYRLRFNWKIWDEQRPKSVVLKIPGPNYDLMNAKDKKLENPQQKSEENPEFFDQYMTDAHAREIAFYEHFHRIGSFRLPRFYYGADYSTLHRDGIMLMEDLSAQACGAPILPEGFSDAQVHALLDELARVHAASWSHPEWHAHVLGPIDDKYNETGSNFVELTKQAALELAEMEPALLGPLIRQLLLFFRDYDILTMTYYFGEKYGFPASIVHGDLWAPNMLWEKDAQGKPSDNLAAIIDWQTVHSGNPCDDICHLLTFNTTGHYRRENTEQLLAYYASKVSKSMPDGKAPFTLDQLRQAYKYALPFKMLVYCFGASIHCSMDSVVGTVPAQRETNRTELFRRVRMFLEDVMAEFSVSDH